MRTSFALRSVSLMFGGLVIVSGCGVEPTATTQKTTRQSAYVPASAVTEFGGDQTSAIFSSSEIVGESERSMLESRVTFETEDPGKLVDDTSKSDINLKEAWRE